MKLILISALLVSATAAFAAPLLPAQSQQIRCVAALAIVANDQGRGAGDWADFPPLAKRGAKFAGVVGEDVMKAGGLTKEAVRTLILADVAMLQKNPDTLRDVAGDCMDVMETALPKPSLPACAAMVALANDDVQRREGFSETAKMLTTFSAVLNSRARDQLRAEGKSESESDVVIGLAREKVEADAKASLGEDFDLESCFETNFFFVIQR